MRKYLKSLTDLSWRDRVDQDHFVFGATGVRFAVEQGDAVVASLHWSIRAASAGSALLTPNTGADHRQLVAGDSRRSTVIES